MITCPMFVLFLGKLLWRLIYIYIYIYIYRHLSCTFLSFFSLKINYSQMHEKLHFKFPGRRLTVVDFSILSQSI